MNPTRSITSLYEAFATVPDPRSRFGRSHLLASLSTMAAVAMLCGCRSLYPGFFPLGRRGDGPAKATAPRRRRKSLAGCGTRC